MNIQLQKRTRDLTIDVKGVRKDKNNIRPENEKLGRNRTMTTKRKEGREGGRERKEKERKSEKEITEPSRNRENYRKSHEYSSG